MSDDSIPVTFHPQAWTDSPGQAHDWGRKQLVPAEERESVTFTVPRADATDEERAVFADESYRANQLQGHPAAPEWVGDWDGPYYVTLDPTTTDD